MQEGRCGWYEWWWWWSRAVQEGECWWGEMVTVVESHVAGGTLVGENGHVGHELCRREMLVGGDGCGGREPSGRGDVGRGRWWWWSQASMLDLIVVPLVVVVTLALALFVVPLSPLLVVVVALALALFIVSLLLLLLLSLSLLSHGRCRHLGGRGLVVKEGGGGHECVHGRAGVDGEKVVVTVRGQAWVVVTYVREGRPGEGERVSWWWSHTCMWVGGQALVVKEGGGGCGVCLSEGSG